MSVELYDIVLFGILSMSVSANVVLVWFTRKLTKQFAETITEVDILGAEINAFADATEALCESEVYLLGEEPVVKSVRSNAKKVLKRVDTLLRNIPNAWQLPEMEEPENLNDEQQ